MASEQNISVFSDSTDGKNDLLLFTNGKGEPKCIDVEDTLVSKTSDAGLYSGSTSGYDKQDFLDACPRVDLRPLTFEFENDGSTRSFFKKSRGIQFSYQVIYRKGSISAPAPFSQLAIPPAIFSAGTDTLADVEIENVCNVYFPLPGAEVLGYRFLFREGNDGALKIVEDIFFEDGVSSILEEDTTGNTAGYYPFRNDVTGSILSEVEALKTFDNLPREAFSQEVTEDRLNYANYKEGYNNLDVSVDTSIEFYEAPAPGYEFNLKVIPTVFKRKNKEGSVLNGVNSADVENRHEEKIGFGFDTSSLPDQISAGVYDVTINVSPQKNFHLFFGEGGTGNGFTGTPTTLENQTYQSTQSPPDLNFSGIYGGFTPHSREGVLTDEDFLSPAFQAIADFSSRKGANRGVTIEPNPQFPVSMSSLQWQSTNGAINVSTGRHSTSPFILKGGKLKFRAVVQVPEGGVQKFTFTDGLLHAFFGLPPADNPLVTSGGTQLFPLSDVDWFANHSYDLNLENGLQFDHEGNENSDLIISFTSNNGSQQGGQENAGAPEAFGIVNRVSANFCLEPANSPAGFNKYFGEISNTGNYRFFLDGGGNETYKGIFVTLAYIDDIDIKTCVPVPVPQFGSLISQQSFNALIGYAEDETDQNERLNARRYVGRGTSPWDLGEFLGNDTLVWPSIEKQLMIGGVPHGPAMQHLPQALFSDAVQANSTGSVVQYTTDLGFPMSGSATAVSNQHAGGDFKSKRQVLDCDNNGIDGRIQADFHPAPIGSWIVLNNAATASSGFWIGKGFFAYKDVPDSDFYGSDVYLSGRPSTMLGNLSKYYEGGFEDGELFFSSGPLQGICKIGYTLSERPTGGVASLKPRSIYSLVDGFAGPGGGDQALTRGYGYSGSGQSDAWGDPFTNGTHDASDISKNICGAYANKRGSVTAFSLFGYIDNMPGMLCGEITKRGLSDFEGYGSEEVRLAMFKDQNLSRTFVKSTPRMIGGPTSGIISIQGQFLPKAGDTNLLMQQTQAGDNVSVPLFFGGVTVGATSTLTNYAGQQSFLPDTHAFYNTSIGYNQQGTLAFQGHEKEIKNSWPATLTSAIGNGNASINSDSIELFSYSFKTNASHEFGIVYYDEKGRHGGVQPCPSVFVPGYSDRPDGNRGPVRVSLKINHAPPVWADSYRVVYAGNNNVERFVQYTVDGAYARNGSLYVNLNTLQGDTASFNGKYPAVNQYDGSKEIYRFAEGDFLRVLYYSDSTGALVYPDQSWEFPIVDLLTLSPQLSVEDHPLFFTESGPLSDPTFDIARSGQMLVVENNPSATNFSIDSVQSSSDFWKNRCVVEIVRPKDSLSDEARPYYETNYGGKINNPGTDSRTHEFNTINMLEGDVYFRSVPVAIQEYDDNLGEYVPVVSGTVAFPSRSDDFAVYYLEADGFSDFNISKSKNYGRLHFVSPNQSEVTRESSISFSELTAPGSYDINWLSFPPTGNFKDLNTTFGSIKKIDYDGSFMNVFFENQVTRVPYNRNMISSLQDDILVAATKVYGTEKEREYNGGVGKHPESVIRVDQNYYFVNPETAEIIMLRDRQAPVIISNLNVSSYFKEQFEDFTYQNPLKISTGYDSRNRELLVTLFRNGDSVFWPESYEEYEPLATLAFDLKTQKFWKTRYSFRSSDYINLGDKLISFHADASGDDNTSVYPWIHSNNVSPAFIHGKSSRTAFTSVLNDQLNQSKTFNSVILDSEKKWDVNVKTGKLINEEDDISISVPKFYRYYEKMYGPIPHQMESVQNPDALDYTQMYQIPTFPLNNHGGQWVKFRPNFKHMGGSKFRVRMPYPKGHPIFQTAFPQGEATRLFEIGVGGTVWDGPGNKIRRARHLGTNRVDNYPFITNDVQPYGTQNFQEVGNWSIVDTIYDEFMSTLSLTTNNAVDANGFEVQDLVFEADFGNLTLTQGLIPTWVDFYEQNAAIHDEHGYLYVRDAWLNQGLGGVPWPQDNLEFGFTRFMDYLFSPLYSYYFTDGSEKPGLQGDSFNLEGSDNLKLCFKLNYLNYATEVTETGQVWENEYLDFNNDGAVTVADLLLLLTDFSQEGEDLVTDVNNDGTVSVADILALLSGFGSVNTDEDGSYTVDSTVTLDLEGELTFVAWLVRTGLYTSLSDANKKIKTIYSRYGKNVGEGTKVRGRFLEIECSSTNVARNPLFGIEVDYDIDVKKSSSSLKSTQRRRKRR